METKICKKCNIEKNIENFRMKKGKNNKYYRYSYCKDCEKEYINSNKEIKKKADKKYRETHKEEIKIKAKIYRKNNPIILTSEQKEKQKKYLYEWRKNNPEKIKKYYTKDNKKRREDPILHFKDQIRHEILRSFNSKKKQKNKHTEEILGCDINFFIKYLLNTYKNNYGIEWDKKEKIHIDHIIPLSIAKTENEIIRLCHYTNLQLLKEKDNLKKYNKLNWKL